MMHQEIENIHHVIEPLLKKAGSRALSFFRKPITWKRKKNGGVVTQADYEVETYIITALKSLLAGPVGIIAEESGIQGDTTEYSWVIDPIDGTSNFMRGIPYFCISLALTYNNEPLFAALYEPVEDAFFYAYAHTPGAYRNGEPITVHPVKEGQNLVIIGLPQYKQDIFKLRLHESTGIQSRVAYRYFGAGALDQVYLACGRVDGLYFKRLQWWDVAAGILLIEKAGGIVTDFRGDRKSPTGDKSLIAGCPLVYQALREAIHYQ
jgi:myo-inositol-1(or 4)-monophosphatase